MEEFYENEIADVISLEDVNGPFGHFSEAYGLLEKEWLEWGSDLIGAVLDSNDEIQILRMLICMDDNFQSLKERAIPGMALWHKKTIKPDEVFDDEGVVYLGNWKMTCVLS